MLRLAVVMVCVSSAAAWGDPPPVTTLALDPPSSSYRVEMGMVNFGSLAVDIAAVGPTASETRAIVLFSSAAIAPALVHLGHHRPGSAAASLLLHLALPLAGGLVMDRLTPSCSRDYPGYDLCDDEGRDIPIGFGVALGVLAAGVIDTAYLAR